MGGEGRGQIVPGQRIDDRQAAEAADAAELRNDRFAVGDRVAEEGDTVDGDIARAQSLDRQQAVVDRAERGARADDDRDLPAREQVGIEQGARDRDERAARAFDDQRAPGGVRRAGSMVTPSISAARWGEAGVLSR